MSASAGRVLLLFKGEYSALTTYTAMDGVFYNGSTYVAKQTTLGNVPTNTTYWQILCQGQLSGNFYGTSATAGATAEKAVTIPTDEHFILQQGDVIGVVFTNENTANNPTLNVNNTGAKAIKYNGAVVTTSELWTAGEAGILTMFQYDGTNWVWFAHGIDYNTTYTPEKLGIGIGECATAASTTAKEATLTGYELKENGIVAVKFTYAVPAGSTLNINSKGAKPIYYQGAAIVDQVIRAGYTATFAYDGTNYVLISVDKSAGHEIKNPNGTTMTQRSALKFVGGVSVTDDSTNDQTIINVMGHTIVDSDDTDMAQRVDLQFVDAHLTDDSQNEKTVIENIKSVTEAQFESATEDGLYDVDVEGAEIGEISEDYVEVTASSDTYKTALNKLRNEADFDKITKESYIKFGNNVYIVTALLNNEIYFSSVLGYAGSGGSNIQTIFMPKSGVGNCSFQECVFTSSISRTNKEESSVTDGTKITLYYGNDKAVVDLQTTANRCLMSDGETVESKLGELIKVVDVPYSDFAWNNSVKAFVSQGTYPAPSGYTAIGFLVYCTNGDAMMSARYGSSSYNVRVLGWIPGGGTPQAIDSTYKFICKVLFQKS